MRDFIQGVLNSYNFIGWLFAIIGFISTGAGVYLFLSGIGPLLLRLGNALWKREIAVFAEPHRFAELKQVLLDSKVFNEKNIIHIAAHNFDRAKGVTIFLVDWHSCQHNIEDVFRLRSNHQTPIVIHAKPGTIPIPVMDDIANRLNTDVVNFKGRLIYVILMFLITTAYEK